MSAPHVLKLRAVDDAVEISVVVEAGAPELVVASGDGVVRTGTHLGIGGDIDRPGVAAVGGEVHAAHVRVNIAAAGPARLASQEQDRTDRPRAVEQSYHGACNGCKTVCKTQPGNPKGEGTSLWKPCCHRQGPYD